MIEICGVSKKIECSTILEDINIHIGKGSIFGLIGPNGAGKSSLLKTMMGIWKPDKGFVQINGQYVFDNPEVKESIGLHSGSMQFL